MAKFLQGAYQQRHSHLIFIYLFVLLSNYILLDSIDTTFVGDICRLIQ